MKADAMKSVAHVAVRTALALVAFCAMVTLVSCARYPNPSMEVDSYEALQEALAGYSDIRFPDLSRYEEVPGFSYVVCRNRITGNVGSDFYSVRNYGDGEQYGMKGAAASVGVDSGIAQLDFDCRDLRKYDGHYRVAPTVTPTEEHSGVGIESRSSERAVSGDNDDGDAPLAQYPDGATWGTETLSFIVGDFYYRISANYGIMPGFTDVEADAVRDAFHDEVQQMVYSIIGQ